MFFVSSKRVENLREENRGKKAEGKRVKGKGEGESKRGAWYLVRASQRDVFSLHPFRFPFRPIFALCFLA
jgi:hypothetical protein